MENNNLSIIIPAYNAEATITKCLDSLLKSKAENDEVIVVDNNSSDDTKEIVKSYPVKLAVCEKRGAAAARNCGTKLAKNDIFVFLDSDTIVQSDSLEKIRELMSEKNVSAVNGIYTPTTPYKNNLTKFQNLYTYNNYVQIGGTKERVNYEPFWSAFGAVKKKQHDEIGGFDESLCALEDIEFGVRLANKGHRIMLDKTIQNTHDHPFGLKKFFYNDYNKTKGWVDISAKKGLLKYEGYDNLKSKALLFLANLFLLSLAITPFLMIFINKLFILFPLIILMTFFIVNINFFRLANKYYGFGFMLISVPISIMSFFFIAVGILGGIKEWSIKKKI